MDILKSSIKELLNNIKNNKISIKEVVDSYLQSIAEKNDELNTFITIFQEEAKNLASNFDKELDKSKVGETLFPLPIGIKDNINIKDKPTTCGSKILENFISPYDATVINKLKEASAIFIGKLNMDEFAMGSSNENSYFGAVSNPYDVDRVPGGSSGGSAAAVAAGLVPWALGSDTGGSIRQPAALCGVVGMKPTYGRVSRYGLVAFASSFDQIGPITKTVWDNALLLSLISGHDLNDSTSANVEKENFTQDIDNFPEKLVIGIPKEFFTDSLQKEIYDAIMDVKKQLERLGVEFIDISLPHSKYSIPTYYILTTAEASSNLERFDGVRYGFRADDVNSLKELYIKTRTEGFGIEVKRRIMLGTFVLSSGYYEAYYLKASKVRTLIKNDFVEAFKKCDLVMAPTTPNTAFKKGDKLNDPLTMYLSDIYTTLVNIAGIPAISLPIGFDNNNLPIGLQLIGNYFDEKKIYQVANKIEKLRKG